ncbi:hypothetical protein DB346_01070 [Verrucomicrobia bacterium LW23]|nr:hypothetical protein DB346_01070 [Verrucomicrobia bacterium LW23]
MSKRVTLLGDSIRIGYQATVKEQLADVAEVWSPEGNGMHSVHHLCNMGWYLDQPADLIHFNFGLWDCRRLGRVRTDNLVPLETYLRNLDYLLEVVRGGTSAKLIWATITPLVQERYGATHAKGWSPWRVNEDIVRFNEAAAPVLARHGVQINDLGALVHQHGPASMICEDGVHYTPEGSAVLGTRVASVIREALAGSPGV